ncbi:MAG TPA: hypothetical protein DE036_07385 [Actinobacteria bacterium]|nr:hypothetical protein [Actinomycetota bacterium]
MSKRAETKTYFNAIEPIRDYKIDKISLTKLWTDGRHLFQSREVDRKDEIEKIVAKLVNVAEIEQFVASPSSARYVLEFFAGDQLILTIKTRGNIIDRAWKKGFVEDGGLTILLDSFLSKVKRKKRDIATIIRTA